MVAVAKLIEAALLPIQKYAFQAKAGTTPQRATREVTLLQSLVFTTDFTVFRKENSLWPVLIASSLSAI